MANKSLKDKAIKIQGKDYVLVSDRIIFFNQTYPNGSIYTELVSEPSSDLIVIKAYITPDVEISNRKFTGFSQATKGAGFINKTSALENAETSAVGRALAMMGIGVIDSVASVDEINKAKGTDSTVSGKTSVAISKAKLMAAFKTAGIEDWKTQKEILQRILNKETVDTVDEANKVMEELKAGVNSFAG